MLVLGSTNESGGGPYACRARTSETRYDFSGTGGSTHASGAAYPAALSTLREVHAAQEGVEVLKAAR